jgi:hypothetical protein
MWRDQGPCRSTVVQENVARPAELSKTPEAEASVVSCRGSGLGPQSTHVQRAACIRDAQVRHVSWYFDLHVRTPLVQRSGECYTTIDTQAQGTVHHIAVRVA